MNNSESSESLIPPLGRHLPRTPTNRKTALSDLSPARTRSSKVYNKMFPTGITDKSDDLLNRDIGEENINDSFTSKNDESSQNLKKKLADYEKLIFEQKKIIDAQKNQSRLTFSNPITFPMQMTYSSELIDSETQGISPNSNRNNVENNTQSHLSEHIINLDDDSSELQRLRDEVDNLKIQLQRSNNVNQSSVINPFANLQFTKRELKFQNFWQHDPENWFTLLESQFQSYGIFTDDDKYWTLMKNLNPAITLTIQGSLRALPTGHKFEAIKKALIDKYGETEEQRLDKFMKSHSLGNQLPSVFLNKLLGDGQPTFTRDAILKIWQNSLPTEIRLSLDENITSVNEKTNIDRADHIYKILQRGETQIDAVSKNLNHDLKNELTDYIKNEISALANKYQKNNQSRKSQNKLFQNNDFNSSGNLSNSIPSCKKSCCQQQQISRQFNNSNFHAQQLQNNDHSDQNVSQNFSKQITGLCCFHKKYKKNAWSCIPPCSWVGSLAQRPQNHNRRINNGQKEIGKNSFQQNGEN